MNFNLGSQQHMKVVSVKYTFHAEKSQCKVKFQANALFFFNTVQFTFQELLSLEIEANILLTSIMKKNQKNI